MNDNETPAKALNDILCERAPEIFSLLSKRGRFGFFPHGGILGQTAEAKSATLNATIGISLDDGGVPLHLTAIQELLNLPSGSTFPYAPGFGIGELRTTWKEHQIASNPSVKSGTMTVPVVTAGITHALSIAGHLFLDEGDEIIAAAPHWDNYHLLFEQTFGARLSTYALFDHERFNVDAFEHKMTSRSGKQVVLFNFPNNPTGYTLLAREADRVIDILLESAKKGNHIAVILDDAYAGLTYEEDALKESLFALLSNLHKNILAAKIDGASKEDYCWGLRIGFVTLGWPQMDADIARALEDKVAGVVRATVSNVSLLSQTLVLRALKDPRSKQDQKHHYALLKRRFIHLRSLLDAPDVRQHFTLLPANSGYFLCLEPKKGIEAEKVRAILLKDFGIGVIQISGLLRIAFSSLSEENMQTLVSGIVTAAARCAR